MLVSKPTHGGGAPLGIDLEAGTAKIKIPRRSAAPSGGSDEPAGADSPPGAAAGVTSEAPAVEPDRSAPAGA